MSDAQPATTNGPEAPADDAMVRAHHAQLFADPDVKVYAVLDGASIDGLLPRLAKDAPEHICLYRGEIDPVLAEAAPYLVLLEPDAPFTDWVLRDGWLGHWGIFALSAADMPAVRNHFRRFLMVTDADGKQLYFRYYDPRVLRAYLPTCNAEERATIFGPVTAFFIENEEQEILVKLTPGNNEAGVPC